MSAVYDITKTLEENVVNGPFWDGDLPVIHNTSLGLKFLGIPLNSPFGVAACPLTINSKYIQLMSRLGYDLITYKSVRSIEWKGNEFPNWMHADVSGQFVPTQIGPPIHATFDRPSSPDISMVNSFGISSPSPDVWQKDVNKTCSLLSQGQILILSLMLTPQTGEILEADAERLGKLAGETDAQVFELDLSCPNSDESSGELYENPEHAAALCSLLSNGLGGRPLFIKIGYYADPGLLAELMKNTKGIIGGISSMNTLSVPSAAFPGRSRVGLSGAAIRKLTQDQLLSIIQLKKELNMPDLATIHIGGVTKPEHIQTCLAAGADAVQSAVGVWDNPHLARDWKSSIQQ